MGRSQMGYAVIELVHQGSLHPLKSDFTDLRSVKVTEGVMSAQRAEIMALTEACRALTGLKGSIFTDSAYAFGVAHYYGKIWANNGYRKSNGKPITHEKEIRALIEAYGGYTVLVSSSDSPSLSDSKLDIAVISSSSFSQQDCLAAAAA
ncbi:hypothetical protein DPEC_G00187880 [Dallia pectoralis]|uniref:Uncharacterized protein n=1 Tax=Dallia pectoralis TaxID=75939 RepID=A0ACC2GC61_DALPE|nr:hypothetical protein DPEC_G00187880 [Dallia pectoralis]